MPNKNRVRAAKLAVASCVLMAMVGGGIVGLSASAIASAPVANATFYWNAGTADACAGCAVTLIVEAFPNTQTPPTDNSGLVFQNGSAICGTCIQYLSPGADNDFGYWFAQMSWNNYSSANDGNVGFLIGFTNQS